ncbi:MAG TPA: fibronectin type III domain-containing protein, partial [Solirubrobacteraceae bacterium]
MAEGFKMCGTLNPHSSEKVAGYFAYNQGASCAGGSLVPADAGKEEGQGIEVYAYATGLEPATEYTYCVVAKNSFGETLGGGLTFVTPPVTQTPRTEAATDIASTSAILEGSLEPAGTRLHYEFEENRGSDCKGGDTTPVAEGEDKVSATVEGLTPNAEYTFCLIATSVEGGTAAGMPVHFRTPESQAEVEAKERAVAEARARAEAEAQAEAKAIAEAAAAKRRQEEAAESREEQAAAERARLAWESTNAFVSLRIVDVRVAASSVLVTLGASQRGAVTISGRGLKTTTESVSAGS